MNGQSTQELQENLAASKVKMILGIVFFAVGFFFTILGINLVFEEEALVVFILLGLGLMGAGTPIAIIGIVNTIKYNRQISLVNQPNYYAQPQQPQWQPPQGQQWQQPQQPQWQPPQGQQWQQPQQPQWQPPQGQQWQQPQQPQWQPPQEQQWQQPQQPQWQQPMQGDLDWRKYNPLVAGVSLKPGKDYKFHRAEGFVGSVPQNFVNRTFPRCPICCTNEPYWTIAQHNQMSWKGNLYLFKCSCCDSIISMSMPDVTTLGNGAGGVVANPNVGLANLMFKASSGKEAGAVYAVIESVGRSGVTRECEGKEFKLEHLQDMFLRK